MTEAQLRKLKADGIATTGDGYIWINKEKIKDGNTINFNKVVSHEITHQILGEDSEYEARYVESGMEEFLSEIKGNGYLKDGKIIDLLYSRLTDEDRARLNRYVLEDMQFKDLSGGAGDRYTVVNLKYQKIGTALNQAGKNDRISRMYERAKERNKGDKNSISKSERRIKELKDKGNLTKKETAELIKLTGEIYKEEKEITKLTERYESLEEITEDKKEYLTYIAGLKDKRKELEKYEIKILYKDENGNIYVKQTSGNPEEKARQEYYMREMQKNSREGIDQNVIDKALSPISKIEEMISNGEIVEYKGGGIITGYGITKEEAKRNREIKNGMLLNGLLQTGEGAVKATTGVSAIAGGATGCYYSGGMGCGIGLQMIGSGIVVGGMGINETYVGLQNIGYALSSGSGIGKGTAIEEYNRIRKEKGYIPANNVKINNPVLNYIVNKGGDERDYQVISAVTGAMATELNIYNNYYKKNSIVNYVEKERADREKNKGLKIVSKYNDINEYEYNVINPGPLEKLGQNSNFYGGRYNIEVLKVDKIFYRGGDSKGSPLGQYFTETPPESIIKVRIDSAVKPYWLTPEGHYNGKSPINTVYVVKIPAGTTVYKGPVGYQEGVYLGGLRTEQIFIEKPWNLKGIEVINHYPLR